jgi:hypothetical protein
MAPMLLGHGAMRPLLVLRGLLAVGSTAVYMNYGTVEPCGILRERIRQRARAIASASYSLLCCR